MYKLFKTTGAVWCKIYGDVSAMVVRKETLCMRRSWTVWVDLFMPVVGVAEVGQRVSISYILDWSFDGEEIE